MFKPVKYSLPILLLSFPFHSSQAKPVADLLSVQSFTGAFLTPNAEVMKTGNASFLYGQGVPYKNQIAELDNLFFSVGLFKGFEAGGRIVTSTYNCNIYTEPNCGIRDLSASFKYQLPYVKEYTGFNFALGVQDLGGAANNFEAYYAVADYEFDTYPVRFSLGYGQSDLSLGILNGEFASVEVQPFSFMQLTGEYDASQFNSSLKLFTPENALPLNTQFAFQYQLYTGHDETSNANVDMWSINATVPLFGFTSDSPRNGLKNNLSLQDVIMIEQAKSEYSDLTALKQALLEEGFINLNITNDKEKLYIALENRRYNHNQIDGIGVALGIISSYAGSALFADLGIENELQEFQLYTLVNEIPVGKVSGNTRCYREFIASGEHCASLEYQTYNIIKEYNRIAWEKQAEAPSLGRTQIILAPTLRYGLATEYGVWDYSLALSTSVYTSLWKGAAFDIRYILPLANSSDYDDGGYWEESQFSQEFDKALIHQAFTLPSGFMTQFSAGYLSAGNLGVRSAYPNNSSDDYVLSGYLGGINETEWHSPTGRHALGFQLSQFQAIDEADEFGGPIRTRYTSLANYKLAIPEYNWQLRAEAGEYGNGDDGFKLTSSHWLGDARIDASYLQATPEFKENSESFLTLAISVPLTFWRDMSPGYVQLRGEDEFTFSVQTRIGEDKNFLNSGLGSDLNFRADLSRQYNNRDRNSPNYFYAHTERLRNAYLKYIEDVIAK